MGRSGTPRVHAAPWPGKANVSSRLPPRRHARWRDDAVRSGQPAPTRQWLSRCPASRDSARPAAGSPRRRGGPEGSAVRLSSRPWPAQAFRIQCAACGTGAMWSVNQSQARPVTFSKAPPPRRSGRLPRWQCHCGLTGFASPAAGVTRRPRGCGGRSSTRRSFCPLDDEWRRVATGATECSPRTPPTKAATALSRERGRPPAGSGVPTSRHGVARLSKQTHRQARSHGLTLPLLAATASPEHRTLPATAPPNEMNGHGRHQAAGRRRRIGVRTDDPQAAPNTSGGEAAEKRCLIRQGRVAIAAASDLGMSPTHAPLLRSPARLPCEQCRHRIDRVDIPGRAGRATRGHADRRPEISHTQGSRRRQRRSAQPPRRPEGRPGQRPTRRSSRRSRVPAARCGRP